MKFSKVLITEKGDWKNYKSYEKFYNKTINNSRNEFSERVCEKKNHSKMLIWVGAILLIFVALLGIYSANSFTGLVVDYSDAEYEVVNGDYVSDLSLVDEPQPLNELPLEETPSETIDEEPPLSSGSSSSSDPEPIEEVIEVIICKS